MDAITLLLIVVTVCAGIFTGVITTMASVVHLMLGRLNGAEYTAAMQGIITEGRKSRVILVLILVPALGGFVSAALLSSSRSDLAVLAAAAALVWAAGPIMVSRLRAELLYDQIMTWDKSAPPGDWQTYRWRWYGSNLLRGGSALVSFLGFGATTLVYYAT